MNYLLDTHILVWFLFNDKRLDTKTKDIIENKSNHIYFSPISLWELQINKSGITNLKDLDKFTNEIIEAGFEQVPITAKDIYSLNTLKNRNKKSEHKDPFDKMLIAQAKRNELILISHNKELKNYKEKCVIIV